MSQAMKTTLTRLAEADGGALFMPLPPGLLQKHAIREGDKLLLSELPDGTLLLRPAHLRHKRVRRFLRLWLSPSPSRGAQRRGNP